MKDRTENEFMILTKDFDFLLDNFRKVSELYDHIIKYEKETDLVMYSLDSETISQICCDYLSCNLIYYFNKRETSEKGN